MNTQITSEVFHNRTWLLYDAYLQRAALLQLRDRDGSLDTLGDTSYALIYNQQEQGIIRSYFATGNIVLDSWGGREAYRLDNAYNLLNIANANSSGEVFLSNGYDNSSNSANYRLIIPTTETTTGSYLKATYINPINNNGNDWAIAPIDTETSLISTFWMETNLPALIIEGYRRGNNITQRANYDTPNETWLIPEYLELQAEFLGELIGPLSFAGEITTSDAGHDDRDYFVFMLGDTSNGDWSIHLSDANWDADLDLELHRLSDGEIIDSSDTNGSEEELDLSGLPPGKYLLVVDGYEGSHSPYRIHVRAPYAVPDLQPDPSEGLEGAFIIGHNNLPVEVPDLSIHDAEDVDYFQFSLSETAGAGAYIAILLDEESGDLDLAIRDQDGNLIDQSDSNNAIEAINLAGFEAGTYNVSVWGYEGETGRYTLAAHIPFAGLSEDKYEDNNTEDDATDLGTVSGEQQIENLSIHDENDVDYYRFSLNADSSRHHFISLKSDSDAGDLDMELWHFADDSTLEEVAIAESLSAEEFISLEGCKAGNYLLKIYGYESDLGGYTLNLDTPQALFKTDRLEVNNTPQQARQLNLDDTVTVLEDLTIHSQNDVDWYKFTTVASAKKGDLIRLTSDGEFNQINFELYDTTGTSLLSRAAQTPNGSVLFLDGFIGSDYLIKVSAGTPSSYALKLELPDALAQEHSIISMDRFEANNSADEAHNLRIIEGTRVFDHLSIHNSTDRDFYRFRIEDTADARHFAVINFKHDVGDLDLYLTNADTKQQISLSEGVEDSEKVSLKGLTPGNYMLEVVGYEGSEAEYSLTINAPYTTQIAADRYEQNNTFSTATPLRVEGGNLQLESLSIHNKDDLDFFRFEVTSDTSLSHKVIATDTEDIILKLYDQAGTLIRDNTTSIDTENQSLNLDQLTAGATYTLAVSSPRPTSYGLDWRLPQLIHANPGQTPLAKDDWTLMVYMTASDLDAFAFDDINEMEEAVAGFRQAANVVVFLDQSLQGMVPFYATGNNSQDPWHTAGYAIIEADNNPDQIASRFQILEERNSGDPQTLKDFIGWAAEQCPAENYGLVMWDHGGGLSGVNFDNRDNRPEDNIEIHELVDTLSDVSSSGLEFEFTAFDACLMGITELAAALAPLSKTLIASQEVIGGPGYDYTTALQPLMRRGTAPTREEMAQAIVDSFTDQYVGQQAEEPPADTLSAIESSQVESLLSALSRFTKAASEINLIERRLLNEIRENTQYYTNREYKDLGAFLDAISENTNFNPELRREANLTRQALSAVILAKTPDARQSSGLSIYLPDVGQNPQRTYANDHSEFISQTGWWSLLNGLPLTAIQNTPPVVERWAGISTSNLRPFNLGVFSGHGHQLPVNSLQSDSLKQYYAFQLAAPGSSGDAIRLTEGEGALIRLLKADGSTELKPATRSINLQGVPADTYILEVSAAAPVSRYRVTVDAPRAISLPTPLNNTAAKAQNLGLVASQLVVPGQGLNRAESNFFTFSTPRLGFSQPYQLLISSDQQQPLEVRLLTTEQPAKILHTATGTGTVLLTYEAQGAAESYLLEVRSPGGQRQGTSSLNLYFDKQDPKLTILGQAKEGQSLTASLTGIASQANVNYIWQKLVLDNWTTVDQAQSTNLAIPFGRDWSGSTIRVVATVSENGSSRDITSAPMLITSGLDSAYAVTLTPNKSHHDEGAKLNIVFTAPRSLTATAKATLYWAIVPTDNEGTPITTSGLAASDFTGRNSLSGTCLLARQNNRSSLSVSIARDKISELSESFRIQLFADAELKQLLNQSSVITINDSSNQRVATTARDALTGVKDYSDTFILPNLTASRLGSPASPTYDTILNFEAVDKIRLNGQSPAQEASIHAALAGLATISVASLKAADLSTVLNATSFPAHSARLLQVTGHSAGSFLAINNQQGGFNASTDALLYLKDYMALGPV